MTDNTRPPIGATLAKKILFGMVNDVKMPMRFQFVPMDTKPGFVLVHDMLTGEAKAELWHEHAKMIYLMYKNIFNQNPSLAESFMDGHIMGYTLMLTFGQYYPKIEVIREGDITRIRSTEPDGRVSYEGQTDEKTEADLKKRILPGDQPT